MTIEQLRQFAAAYAAAWCSHDSDRVASFFGEGGALTINGGTPSVGRHAIAAAAREFMDAFPDLSVSMDGVEAGAGATRSVFRWTLVGTNNGPGGSGQPVRISGLEEWMFGADRLIADSQGRFDDAEYRRQLREGLGVKAP